MFFKHFFILDHNKTRSFENVIFFIFFRHFSIEFRCIKKIHACIFQRLDINQIKEIQCDDWFMNLTVEWMFLNSSRCRIYFFRDFTMSNMIEKLIVICFISSFHSTSQLIQNDMRFLHNHHEQTYAIVIFTKARSSITHFALNFFTFRTFLFFFARRSRKRCWSNHSSRFRDVELIDVHLLRCNQDWSSLQSRFFREKRIH